MQSIIKIFLLVALSLTALTTNAQVYSSVVLSKSNSIVDIDPRTLEITLQRTPDTAYPISLAIPNLGSITNLKHTSTNATWQFSDLKTTIDAQLTETNLLIHILSEKPGEFTFPTISESGRTKGWILPMFEGVYAPIGDTNWSTFLTQHGELNTTADLTLPFIGLDYGDSTITYIFTNQFNNQVAFQSTSNHLQAKLTHNFTRNHPIKEYAVLIQWSQGSPIEPARIYRQYLIQRGEFISLKQKIEKTPETQKLLGAAHIYLWGDDLITSSDILTWKQFAHQLIAASTATNLTPAKRIWSLLTNTARNAATNIIQVEWPDKYTKSLVTQDLNQMLLKRDFYDEPSWRSATLDNSASELLKRERSTLTAAELTHLNCSLLVTAFPDIVAKPETWGSGLSPKMIQQLSAAGLDRLWLGAAAWDAFVNRPETVAAAKKAGYLIGTYDSYHSMHSPKEKDTWETAQFDDAIYQTGAIVNADGTKRHGFKKKGYLLSPAAARPYVEKRVTQLMDSFHANSWFMDCDGFGEFFDDYSPAHPATQQSDMQNRIARLAWIRDTFGAVIGTEGCSAGIAPTVHFAHGIMTPVIGWGDPDLTNKKSDYYLGAYYPPDEPQVFFKPVPTKEQYRYLYFDPRFRLPLFQTVFHDSVIATHHWSFPSLKTQDNAKTVELLELLYNVPPLYHLNLSEFEKRKTTIKHHYDFFSPLHRQIALLPMTDFKWLTPDQTIQETTFGNDLTITANFSDHDCTVDNQTLPKQTIAVHSRSTGKIQTYTP
ncbi:glycoside hydrolase [Pedosphaera parvula]|uniref:Lipoprotein n=1 Tax=Pedosphaera parvula (strain Ellin514) TaxID=320771 RepID=B9XHV3_PEDPL|nr:glycoside hydrolase [Pedosphaera parvula]EEF60681.1 lipoprotein [Pedosphaera parvula Ellin514]